MSVVNNSILFFDKIRDVRNKDISIFIIGHFTKENLVFVDYLDSIFDVSMLIAKKATLNEEQQNLIKNSYNFTIANRDLFDSVDYVKSIIEKSVNNRKLIILDMGGYFSTTIVKIKEIMALRH